MAPRDVDGPLAFVAVSYRDALDQLGFRRLSVVRQMDLFGHLNEWMVAREIALDEITAVVLAGVFSERRRMGLRLQTAVGARPLLDYLRQQGLMRDQEEILDDPLARLLAGYRNYLLRERGLRPMTVVGYEDGARRFLDTIGAQDEGSLSGLTVADVTRHVITASKPEFRKSPRESVQRLRPFLRYLHVAGVIRGSLAQAVPSPRVWRGAQLPTSPSRGEIDALLRTCQVRTPVGRRDRAILLLLSRLGLRAGEVVAMTLDDIDWRAGEIVVRGKGPRADRLPLPADVGEAITTYLRAGRPRGVTRHLFLRARAPYSGLTRPAVTSMVANACVRARIARFGPHRLRHAVATTMLRSGASLTEVGQLLRHQSVDSTAIYAKVDHTALSLVARRWPGAA